MVPLSYCRIAILGIAMVVAGLVPGIRAAAEKPDDDGWVPLFNGKDLTGWKIPDPPVAVSRRALRRSRTPRAR
jgi:hypothetical protein